VALAGTSSRFIARGACHSRPPGVVDSLLDVSDLVSLLIEAAAKNAA
jgi:hypothetical protein